MSQRRWQTGSRSTAARSTSAALEFTDPKYSKIFSKWPMSVARSSDPDACSSRSGRRKTGEIGIPPEAQAGDYDLVVIGSPTWWLTVNMPIRSYLKSPAAKNVLEGKPFAAYAVSRRYWKGNMTRGPAAGRGSGRHLER